MIRSLLVIAALAACASAAEVPTTIEILPNRVILDQADGRQQLLVAGHFGPRGDADLTRTATFSSSAPDVAEVSPHGVVIAHRPGTATITARLGSQQAIAAIEVRGGIPTRSVSFRTDVIAALSRAGCNSGACHGSPQGKNGFHLSLRGDDPTHDYRVLTREGLARRVEVLNPSQSLLLLKGSGRLPHQGGRLIDAESPGYKIIERWIAAGATDDPSPAVTRLELIVPARIMHSEHPRQRIIVWATFADQSVRDVTNQAVLTSSDPVASISSDAEVSFRQTGESVIMARYLSTMASARLIHVVHDPKYQFRGPDPANLIDEQIFARQRQMQLLPAPVSSDEVFLRRVTLDLTGLLPTAEETASFLASKDPNKRAKWVDTLLERESFAIHWAMKWADVLRGNPSTISLRGVHSFHRYLVRTVASDRPLTEFVTELLTARGNTLYRPAANFFRVARTPEEAAEATAQLFLGVRVQCAKCHNHPFETISQNDYYGLAAYFAGVQIKGEQFGLDDAVVSVTTNREVTNPTTRKPQAPSAFGQMTPIRDAEEDRRQALARWLIARDNPYFARAIVNRIWFHLLGRGLVDPVDDVRDSNPPSHPELLAALAEEFSRGGYRLKPMIRLIVNSRTYQLGATAPAQSRFSPPGDRYCVATSTRMLGAEQILDAISQVTGLPETYPSYPVGTRAGELAEGGIDHPFLQAFSKPVRDVSCECAREEDPSLPQVLHLLNNGRLLDRIRSPESRVQRWLAMGKSPEWIVDQIYLGTLTRYPTSAEKALVQTHLKKATDPAIGLHDLQHALFNVNEFLLRH